MANLCMLVDAVLFVFFLVIAVVAPLLDAQSCLPLDFYPGFLVDLNIWYGREFGDYLVVNKPDFFVALVWLELLFQWPLSLLNLYAIVARKSWFKTSCLVFGVSVFTSMVPILAELVGSKKASDKLLMMYFPFFGFAVLAILRGLLPFSSKTTSSTSGRKLTTGRKKRV